MSARHAVPIKSPSEIEKMRIAGRMAAEVLDLITEHVKPGVTTEELYLYLSESRRLPRHSG